MTRTSTSTTPDGVTQTLVSPRLDGRSVMTAVRAFYLDIAEWADDDPARWAPWAVRCPVSANHALRRNSPTWSGPSPIRTRDTFALGSTARSSSCADRRRADQLPWPRLKFVSSAIARFSAPDEPPTAEVGNSSPSSTMVGLSTRNMNDFVRWC